VSRIVALLSALTSFNLETKHCENLSGCSHIVLKVMNQQAPSPSLRSWPVVTNDIVPRCLMECWSRSSGV
jgi:hypothetical protein